jgi:hypothetical protein
MIIAIGSTEQSSVEKDATRGEGVRLAGLNPSLELNTFHQCSLRGQKILLLFIESVLVLLWGDELLLGIYRQQFIPFMCYTSAKAPDFYFAPSYTRCPHPWSKEPTLTLGTSKIHQRHWRHQSPRHASGLEPSSKYPSVVIGP